MRKLRSDQKLKQEQARNRTFYSSGILQTGTAAQARSGGFPITDHIDERDLLLLAVLVFLDGILIPNLLR